MSLEEELNVRSRVSTESPSEKRKTVKLDIPWRPHPVLPSRYFESVQFGKMAVKAKKSLMKTKLPRFIQWMPLSRICWTSNGQTIAQSYSIDI